MVQSVSRKICSQIWQEIEPRTLWMKIQCLIPIMSGLIYCGRLSRKTCNGQNMNQHGQPLKSSHHHQSSSKWQIKTHEHIQLQTTVLQRFTANAHSLPCSLLSLISSSLTVQTSHGIRSGWKGHLFFFFWKNSSEIWPDPGPSFPRRASENSDISFFRCLSRSTEEQHT